MSMANEEKTLANTKPPRFIVRDIKTKEVVHVMELTHTDKRTIERIEDGFMHKVDFERYYVERDLGPDHQE